MVVQSSSSTATATTRTVRVGGNAPTCALFRGAARASSSAVDHGPGGEPGFAFSPFAAAGDLSTGFDSIG